MKARLREPIEGLEVGTIYELEAGTELFWLKGIDDLYWTPETVLDDWELLQPVSDTTKQAIQEIIEKVYYLGVTSGRGAGLWPEQERYLDEAEYMDDVVSVLEGKE